jgi:hypothetical protein
LYRLDHKTSVLAMFVAEALVDSDSGSLLAAAISRAYAEHAASPPPSDLPLVSDVSYIDYIAAHSPDPVAVARAREHWARQAQDAAPLAGWPLAGGEAHNSTFAFSLSATEWASVVARAHSLGITPYVLVLTCLQMALARVAHLTRFLTHAIVSQRDAAAVGIIGSFHGIARIEARYALDAGFERATARTAVAVAEAIEHSAYPASLSGTPPAWHAADGLPAIRFYMFTSHTGPIFAGIRRRRFRFHGLPPAPLSVSCVYGPGGRQDFVFTSTTAPQRLLRALAVSMRRAIEQAQSEVGLGSRRTEPSEGSGGSASKTCRQCSEQK